MASNSSLISPREAHLPVTQLFTKKEIIGKGAYGAGMYFYLVTAGPVIAQAACSSSPSSPACPRGSVFIDSLQSVSHAPIDVFMHLTGMLIQVLQNAQLDRNSCGY